MSVNELMLDENVLVITPEESLKLTDFKRLAKVGVFQAKGNNVLRAMRLVVFQYLSTDHC